MVCISKCTCANDANVAEYLLDIQKFPLIIDRTNLRPALYNVATNSPEKPLFASNTVFTNKGSTWWHKWQKQLKASVTYLDYGHQSGHLCKVLANFRCGVQTQNPIHRGWI